MLRFLVLFCVLFVGIQGQSTQVSACTSNIGSLPLNAYIEGCITPPCNLPQLEDVVMHIVFRAPRTMRTMRTLATAYLSGGIITLPVPYDLGENAITCNFLNNSYCPVLEGEVLQYTLKMRVESFMPVGTAAPIEFRVVGETNSDAVFCIRVPIVVTAPLNA
ncbi:uncharacterized protein LOC106129949 [Amyelois transitella]|uniref:uncharacterized protein LOC106129949 n=1 Tax=Amyelois transitella TaxID=680683 RepID=UPI00067C3211|nr:uncharacterized protein LOC106129949 [Amyelois transitella]